MVANDLSTVTNGIHDNTDIPHSNMGCSSRGRDQPQVGVDRDQPIGLSAGGAANWKHQGRTTVVGMDGAAFQNDCPEMGYTPNFQF